MECVSAPCEEMETPSKAGRSSLLAGCYTFLSGFRLPWPPSCCADEVDEPATFAVSNERIPDDGSSSVSAGDWYHDLLLQPLQAIVPMSTNHEDTNPPNTASDNDSISATAPLPETQSFTLFPHLPKDLRLEIYELCHPPPRNLILAFPKTHLRAPESQTGTSNRSPPSPRLPIQPSAREPRGPRFFPSKYQRIFADFPSTE